MALKTIKIVNIPTASESAAAENEITKQQPTLKFEI